MSSQILRACIAGGYVDLSRDILFQTEPDDAVVADANVACGGFKDHVEKRVTELEGKANPIPFHQHWKSIFTKELQRVSNDLSSITGHSISADSDGLYEGFICNAEGIEVFASMPEDWRDFPPDPLLKLDYKEWPRSSENPLPA